MRISDWSSDVCSSDLEAAPAGADVEQLQARPVEQQLGRQVPLLVRLRLIQALLAAAEVGAGILAVGVEEEVVELAGKVVVVGDVLLRLADRSEEHTSELQSLMRISYAVFCVKKKTLKKINTGNN